MRQSRSFLRRLAPALAVALCVSAALAVAAQAATPIGAYVRTNSWRFVSQPKLAPPKITVLKKAQARTARARLLPD